MGFLNVDASQVRALSADVAGAVAKVNQGISVTVRKTAYDIEADAKQLAPVDTGNLRSSISTTVSGGGLGTSAVIGPTAEYGYYVEAGTSRMAGQPYMGPAFDRRIPGFAAALGDLGDQLL